MRYVWDAHDRRSGLHRLAGLGPRAALRRWDRRSARWVDGFAAISTAVQARIERCYGRASRVIHPPVDTTFYSPGSATEAVAAVPAGPFLLACSRFVPYKRLDLAIVAADRAGLPLVVAGRGPGEDALRTLAGSVPVPVTFELAPTDTRLRDLYRAAAAFVFPALEDFGIVAVEAQACGTPVVALAEGGTADTVVDGVTGALVDSQDADALAKGILRVLDLEGAARACVDHAARFSTARFASEVRTWLDDARRGQF
jgi:glycosyltransferase involved in cell wall biosynthesis